MSGDRNPDAETLAAIARLVSAAPEMFDALTLGEKLLSAIAELGPQPVPPQVLMVIDTMRTALANASGPSTAAEPPIQ